MSGYTGIVDSTPAFVPGTFDGQDVRLATIGNCQPGLFASGDFLAVQRAAGANMSVDIGAGRAYVDPQAVARQGTYLVWNGTTYNTATGGYTWTAADPTNPRIDLLCIEVGDTDFSGGYTGFKFRVVDGTPNAGATAANLRSYWPAVPAGCLAVAAIRIPAAATTITTANIYNLDNVGGPMVSSRVGVQTFAGSGTILADRGRAVAFNGAAGCTLTLPSASVGAEHDITNITASDTVAVARAGSDTINGGTTSVTVKPGETARFVCLASGAWVARGLPKHLVHQAAGRFSGAGIGTTGFFLTPTGPAYGATVGSASSLFYFDPAELGGSSAKLTLRAWAITETNPTDSNLEVSMHEVTAIGASGVLSTIGSSLGTVTAMPVVNGTQVYTSTSAEFTISTAAVYVIRFIHNVDPGQAMAYGYRLMGRAA